jgi:threonyl-tRNA synthetase
MAVVGKREAENGSVAVRMQGAGQKQEVMTLDDFVGRLRQQISTKALS